MKATITVDVADKKNPFFAVFTNGRDARTILLVLLRIIRAILGGGLSGRLANRPVVTVGTGLATGTVAPTGVQSADTFSVNGQALTATQQRARCTVTVASANVADTVTVGDGDDTFVFTAVASGANPALGQWDQGGTDTADAASLVTAINTIAADPANILYGLVEAKSTAGAVDIYAVTPGTAGNAFTIATSNGTRLAITNDNAGAFAGGAAVANNQFDFIGTNARTAQSLADALNVSTTSIVKDFVKASTRSGVVTCASVAIDDYVELDGIRLKAVRRATDTTGTRNAQEPIDEWTQGDTDTNDAVSLKNCINAHPELGQKFIATNSSGAVTVRELPTAAAVAPRLRSSNGTRLAVTLVDSVGGLQNNGTVLLAAREQGLGGNAVTTASSNGTRLPIGGSAARLLGGTGTSYTF
jgi:hypothetical protein